MGAVFLFAVLFIIAGARLGPIEWLFLGLFYGLMAIVRYRIG